MSTEEENYLTSRTLSFQEKWKMRMEEKKRKGNGKTEIYLDKCVPYFFFFVFLSGIGWLLFTVVPAFHWKEPVWFKVNESFVLYLFVQLLVNWILIHKTDSTYEPQSDEAVPITNAFQESSQEPLATTTSIDVDSSNQSSASTPRGGLNYKMLVATAVDGDNIERKSFPYWSWVPCVMCKRPRPPRCHHCTLCKRCVLKRDHHCYFTRMCIGINNQRYFLYFLFWCLVLTTMALQELIPYGQKYIFNQYHYSYWNLTFPVNLISFISGQLSFLHFHFIIVTWSIFFLFFISCGMFSITLYLTLRGLTKFEYDNNIKILDTRSMTSRLRSVMGRNWGIPLLLPGFDNGGPLENAVKWPHIKP